LSEQKKMNWCEFEASLFLRQKATTSIGKK